MNNFLKWFIAIGVYSVVFSTNKLQSQTFERIETVAGLGISKENNGVSIADYDADGDLDLFIVAKAKDEDGVAKSHSRLFSNNNNGTFQDVTDVSGLVNLFPIEEEADYFAGLDGFKHGAFWGDYDNDGFPDLLLTNTYKIQLFHNETDGTFNDVTVGAGIQKYSQCINTGATWFDYNKDGFLDFYVSDWGTTCEGNRLYRNNGDGTFTNVSSILQGAVNKHSYQSIPFDFNNDGWLDLYVANDLAAETNDLFINQNGTGFIEQASTYGLDYSKDAMGIAIGDYNNDGLFDMYITTITENALFTNQGGNYVDLAREQDVFNTGWAWDAVFSDFDLDSDEDLLVVNGFEYGGRSSEKNFYFENLHAEGDNRFINSSAKTNLDEITISMSAGVFDYDNDGDLDIFITNTDRPSYFYENKITDFTLPTPNLHWLKVELEGTTSNRNAIGTTLKLTTNQGTLHRYYTGQGFLSQSLKSVHFGLGAATEIQSLKITWPSGLVETHNNLPIDKTIKAKEGLSYEVSTAVPSIKIYGCTDPNSCNYNPNATLSSGACIYLQKKEIEGETRAIQSHNEFYTYPLSNESTATWTVGGGEILQGQNGGIIKVKWGIGNTGVITLVEANSTCISEPVELIVKLRAAADPPVVIEHSVARLWNDALLEAIRKDYARPTVHARNLFHTSIAMYDAWSIYSKEASTYLIGKTVQGFTNAFNGFETTENLEEARDKTISYAAYRLLLYRFKDSPNLAETMEVFDDLMNELGYSTNETNIDYRTGDPIALGNHIAETIIAYGHSDGANEVNKYENIYYMPINTALVLNNPEESEALVDPNRWQPLRFNTFIDQSGNLITGSTPGFLGPEWGNVKPFSLNLEEKVTHQRLGNKYNVYHDPGAPPYLSAGTATQSSEAYKWGFSLVSEWGAHLDPYDGVLWDISPKSIGNIKQEAYPRSYSEYPDFYKESGGDIGEGHTQNPFTQTPYQSQMVPRGDYARVLAEFWADGPDSETPPGHWFTLLNYVSDHDVFEKKFNGIGTPLEDLEWDVKSYFIMGGAMHDSAITAWSIKGWYDYIRPISAIRYMCETGQSSDTSKANYNIAGIPLKPGSIELVEMGDLLAGDNNEHVGEIKVYSWKGHDYIEDVAVDQAGVDWILAENWWPYQRPSFVTPPFAGYISGHSTYSRAAAEVMTLLTGDAFFPGGYGEFIAKKDEFLVFEEGPSVDVKLQWATYRDASDQCSLSRIWGGIHPPADDIPGRLIGEQIGQNSFYFASAYFTTNATLEQEGRTDVFVYPNPTLNTITINTGNIKGVKNITLYDMVGKYILSDVITESGTTIDLSPFSKGIYVLNISNKEINVSKRIVKH